MSKLNDLLKRLQKADPDSALIEVLEKARNEQFIAELVRKRLFEKGETSTGKKLKTYKARQNEVYAPYTIAIKQAKGQPTNRVTLRDTGSFYKSMELAIQKRLFNIEADTDKEDGQIEDNVDLTNVLNLSDNELTELVNEIKSEYIQAIRSQIRI